MFISNCWDVWRNSMLVFCVFHVYLRVEVPEAAAEDTTPKLVMDSIRPPYTILFRMSSFSCKSFIRMTSPTGWLVSEAKSERESQREIIVYILWLYFIFIFISLRFVRGPSAWSVTSSSSWGFVTAPVSCGSFSRTSATYRLMALVNL